MTAKTAAVTPKLLPATAAAVYTDDVNVYSGGGGGGACVVHRPLPSLPRRMDGSWAKSVRSDASGSDASLHWDTQDDDMTAVDVDDLSAQPVQRRSVRCRSVAAGTGDVHTAADLGDDGRCPQSVPGCRTMPRPGATYGALVVSDVDRQRLLVAQQLQQQLRPTDSSDARPYANILSDHSVDV